MIQPKDPNTVHVVFDALFPKKVAHTPKNDNNRKGTQKSERNVTEGGSPTKRKRMRLGRGANSQYTWIYIKAKDKKQQAKGG